MYVLGSSRVENVYIYKKGRQQSYSVKNKKKKVMDDGNSVLNVFTAKIGCDPQNFK